MPNEERRLGLLVERTDGGGGEATLWPSTADHVRPIREVRHKFAAWALALHSSDLAAPALAIAANTLRSCLEE